MYDFISPVRALELTHPVDAPTYAIAAKITEWLLAQQGNAIFGKKYCRLASIELHDIAVSHNLQYIHYDTTIGLFGADYFAKYETDTRELIICFTKNPCPNWFNNISPEKHSKVIKWFYESAHGLSHTSIPLEGKSPLPCFYPQIENLEKFWDDFYSSSANVLLLAGPPGTGKTSFIRGMLRHGDCQAWVTYDPKVQNNERLYTRFLKDDENYDEHGEESTRALILEDCDEMLLARTEGNRAMARLLNLSDGLITLTNRKFILSTNLSSLTKIDEALLRPGRCFAIVNFSPLNAGQANKVCKTMGFDKVYDSGTHTIAQILSDSIPHAVTRKIGF